MGRGQQRHSRLQGGDLATHMTEQDWEDRILGPDKPNPDELWVLAHEGPEDPIGYAKERRHPAVPQGHGKEGTQPLSREDSTITMPTPQTQALQKAMGPQLSTLRASRARRLMAEFSQPSRPGRRVSSWPSQREVVCTGPWTTASWPRASSLGHKNLLVAATMIHTRAAPPLCLGNRMEPSSWGEGCSLKTLDFSIIQGRGPQEANIKLLFSFNVGVQDMDTKCKRR